MRRLKRPENQANIYSHNQDRNCCERNLSKVRLKEPVHEERLSGRQFERTNQGIALRRLWCRLIYLSGCHWSSFRCTAKSPRSTALNIVRRSSSFQLACRTRL